MRAASRRASRKLHDSPECVQVASALCASYVGGSLNFAAVAASLGLAPGPLLAAAMAADNIMMAIYLAAVGVCPAAPPPARAASTAAQGVCLVLGVPLGCLHVVAFNSLEGAVGVLPAGSSQVT